MSKVLVLATSRKTRGGITSVIKAHEQGQQWKDFHCTWIETVRDGNPVRKVFYLGSALIKFIFLLPSSSIIHVHCALGISLKRKNIFIYIAKKFGKKIIIHLHAADPSTLTDRKYTSLYVKTFNKADKIITLSESWKCKFVESLHIDPNKIEIIFNPAPKVVRKHQKEPIILFAGTLIKRKGYDTLIKAFAKVSLKYPQWRLVLAGNGEIDEARSLISELKIEDEVVLPGWVNGSKKEELFQKASIFCLPSQAEGFPMAVLDAWAYGIPCVLTPVGGIPDLVEGGVDAILTPVDDADALSKSLNALMGSPELRNSIVKNTDNRINNDFSLTKICNRIAEIYKELC